MHFLIWLSQCRRQSQSWPTPIISSLLFLSLAWPLVVGTHHMDYTPRSNPHKLECRANNNPPLIITNNCPETIYPGILSQSGIGPGTGGFELSAGTGKTFSVSENWQGRVWGRTNCSFNSYGTGSASGRGPACSTGDCGALSCIGTVCSFVLCIVTTYTRGLTLLRAKYQQHWLNLPSTPAMATPTTTSPSWMAIISQWLLFCIRIQTLHSTNSLPI